MIRKEIARLGIPALDAISIDTVERYQGSQRDVIIYSFTVRNFIQLNFLTENTFREEGHTIDRKLNVAITRARKQLFLTGYREPGNPWRKPYVPQAHGTHPNTQWICPHLP